MSVLLGAESLLHYIIAFDLLRMFFDDGMIIITDKHTVGMLAQLRYQSGKTSGRYFCTDIITAVCFVYSADAEMLRVFSQLRAYPDSVRL